MRLLDGIAIGGASSFVARLCKDRARLTARGGSGEALELCVRKCAQ